MHQNHKFFNILKERNLEKNKVSFKINFVISSRASSIKLILKPHQLANSEAKYGF